MTTEESGFEDRPKDSVEGASENFSEEQDGTGAPIDQPEGGAKHKDKSNYGSAVRRAGRNIKKSKEAAQVALPPWFNDRNVLLHADIPEANLSTVQRSPTPPGVSNSAITTMPNTLIAKSTPSNPTDPISAALKAETLGLHNNLYEIDEDILSEVQAMTSAGLQSISSNIADNYLAIKSHIVLQCPKDGGSLFLDSVVRYIARKRGSDLVEIDAQDIAEIGGDFFGEMGNGQGNLIRSLGYDVHLMMARQDYHGQDENAEEEDEYDEDEDEDDYEDQSRNKSRNLSTTGKSRVVPIMTVSAGTISDLFKSSKVVGANAFRSTDAPSGPSKVLHLAAEAADKLKTTLLIEALLKAPQDKRSRMGHPSVPPINITEVTTEANEDDNPTSQKPGPGFEISDSVSSTTSRQTTRDLIVAIKDYSELNATLVGGKVLTALHEIVQKRRAEGQRILIIGTTSASDLIPSISKSGFRTIQTEASQSPTKTIVTPSGTTLSANILAQDQKTRTKQINMRHLRDMMRRITPSWQTVDFLWPLANLDIDSAQVFASGLDEAIWPIERIRRTATVALGLVPKGKKLTATHLTRALALTLASDDAKFSWILEDKDQTQKHHGPLRASHSIPSPDKKKESEERMRKLRKTCNTHEKKLLAGVIDPDSINTTFNDVRAPPATIEALKTLTSLSLIRPEAFTYGVLATDKIPGLLLYGPPGTGKTLLAKAVAKESGATVLEVSGSDVYDMYVGEGEKNVRALFTLAKKLTPCVVFIDEADAIFGSRGTSSNRTSHRELINQFLREWDGMNDLSAFIMVATNRPFDLDDAVLRRLPRRLLVDLPVEKDREAILRIHLKDETLGPAVSHAKIASETPFYSGSDLKNLCVAAALACVREENEEASKHAAAAAAITASADGTTSSTPESEAKTAPYIYPKRRVLAVRHFDKAMEEISASISEDMSSLAAIRKFDEKYGDRRGRKKGKTYGFGVVGGGEKVNNDAVRVRS